jgi:hypothetical protein
VLAFAAAPAAATPVSGSIERAGDNVVRITLTNSGSSDDIGVAVEFHPPVTVVSATRISGPPGNCAPDGSQPNRVLCLLDPPGMAPGQSIVIEVLTNPRVEDNAGANAYSCGIPCNTSMMSGPYSISGPAPPGDRADLGVDLKYATVYGAGRESHGLAWYDIVPNKRGAWTVDIYAFLRNHGPAVATTPTFTVSATGPPATRMPLNYRGPEGAAGGCASEPGAPGLRPIKCRWDALPPAAHSSDYTELRFSLVFYETGPYTVSAVAASPTPDPGARPNAVTLSDEIERVPEASGLVARRSLIGGFAKFAREALVALGREEGGAKLGEPRRQGSTSTRGQARARASAAGCSWLTSKRVRFRREGGRRCDEPTYLRARVRNGRWKIRLRKPLPPGRYVLIARAARADGMLETAIGPKRGNLKRFRVR